MQSLHALFLPDAFAPALPLPEGCCARLPLSDASALLFALDLLFSIPQLLSGGYPAWAFALPEIVLLPSGVLYIVKHPPPRHVKLFLCFCDRKLPFKVFKGGDLRLFECENAQDKGVRAQTPSIRQTAPSVVIQSPSFPSGFPPPRGIGDSPRIMHDIRE